MGWCRWSTWCRPWTKEQTLRRSASSTDNIFFANCAGKRSAEPALSCGDNFVSILQEQVWIKFHFNSWHISNPAVPESSSQDRCKSNINVIAFKILVALFLNYIIPILSFTRRMRGCNLLILYLRYHLFHPHNDPFIRCWGRPQLASVVRLLAFFLTCFLM